MKAFSGLGIGLSLVFGCLLLALVAEVYYLLRWKKNKRKSKRIISQESEEEEKEEESNGYAKDLIHHLFCFKRPTSSSQANNNVCGDGIERNPDGSVHETQDLELGSSKDMVLMKPFSGDGGFEAELMRFHNQRFLFTIKEETKEDLESDDGKSRKGSGSRTRSLSDLGFATSDNNTPSFLTPLSSPTLKSSSMGPCPHHGFNPLFESEGELEFNRFRSSSPPPKFKFLRDAEEKLRRRLMMEEANRRNGSSPKSPNPEPLNEIEGSFLKFMTSAIIREKQNLQQLHEFVSSSSSRVQPVASSPTKLRTPEQKSTVH